MSLTVHWSLSRFGNPVLVIGGHRFRRSGGKRKKLLNGDGPITWLCIKSDSGCLSYAVTLYDKVVATGHPHVHNIKKRHRKIRASDPDNIQLPKNDFVSLEPLFKSIFC
jgi:hypothetical protein